MKRPRSGELTFREVMKRQRNVVVTGSKMSKFTATHLDEVVRAGAADDRRPLTSLYNKHFTFITTGFDYIDSKIGLLGHSPFLPTFRILLDCFKVFIPVLSKTHTFLLYQKWNQFIWFYITARDLSGARAHIRDFMESLCLQISHSSSTFPPPLDMICDKCNPEDVLKLLLVYVEAALCRGGDDMAADVTELSQVVECLSPWLTKFDHDMKKRIWLVDFLFQHIHFDDSNQSVELFGLILVELNMVCTHNATLELGVKLVLSQKRSFLFQVLIYLASKFPVEVEAEANELDARMTQLHCYEKSGFFHRTICVTIESILSYRLLEDMLHVESHRVAMDSIAMARTLREKDANGDCIAILNIAIELLRTLDAKETDHGPSYFMEAQALCLRALCRYEEHDSSLEVFMEDIDKALKLWSNNEFVNENTRILNYSANILHFVFDVLIMAHNKDSQKLLERILCLFERWCRVSMLWPFKIHHCHLSNQRFHDQLETCKIQLSGKNYDFLIHEGDSIDDLERKASNINKQVPLTLETSCLIAQLNYELGERMLLMGNMTKALEYAREGRLIRHRLVQNSSRPPQNNQSEKRQHALLMSHIVAARLWSLTSEDFPLTPNSNILCYLMSLHQEAKILELMGNGTESLRILKMEKRLAAQRRSSFLAGRFHVAIGKIHRKCQDLKLAKEELDEAKIQCNHITCTRCKLLLQVEIEKECIKLRRIGLFSRNPNFKYVESRLQNESKNGCNCWKRSCGVSMLSILTEKGKDYNYCNDTQNAPDVFMKMLNMVISLSSPSKSQTKFSDFESFFDFVERCEINFYYGTHVAEIVYMISWSFVQDPNECRDHLFSIPIVKLISGLKRALIWSSEIPELAEKLAQLLSLVYFFSHKEITSSQPSHSQWAGFFHQLTVGCGVNYLFSHRLRKVCGPDDPDKLLHRLTHGVDGAKLDKFVTEFFEDLKPDTILVISILGRKYINLLKTRMNLHSDCGGLLMISRFNSEHKSLVGLIPIRSGPTKTTVETIALDLKRIIEDFVSSSPERLGKVDNRVSKLMRHMESWFGQYKYVLLGEVIGGPMTNNNVDNLNGFIGLENASVKSTTCSSCGQSEDVPNRAPIILVLHKSIQMLPWERMEASKKQEFYRMPSVSSIFYTRLKNWEYPEDGSAFSVHLNPFDAFYVISPEKSSDKKQCAAEAKLDNVFKGHNLQGSLWEKNVADEIVDTLPRVDLYMYSGHCDGLQYIPEGRAGLAKFEESCAATILMGCMSALLIVKGPYMAPCAVIEYLLAGSAFVIGNLGYVSSSWALSAYEKLFCEFTKNLEVGNRVGIGSSLVRVRNDDPKHLMFASNSVCYGVPTEIWKP